MRLIHLTTNFYPVIGGIETFVYESSKRLVRNGHKVFVITSNKLLGTNRILPEHEIIDGIEVFRVPFKMFIRYNLSLKLLNMALKMDYDVMHIHGLGFLSDLAPILKVIKKNKIVLSSHGGIFHTPYMDNFKKLYFFTLAKLDLNFVDKIIAHSKQDKKLFSKISNPNKISVVNYGIDWKKLSKTKRRSDGKTLIYTGRLAKNKRLDKMINVLHVLVKSIPNVKLLLVGSDWGEKKSLIKLGKQLKVIKNMKFIGPVPHEKIVRYFSKADLFLLSSEYEGFGMSVVEAMASGLPAVVSNIEPMKEIIKNKKNGYIVDFDNENEVAELITKLLDNKKIREKIGNEAKKSTKNYDWGNIIKKIEEIYG